MNFILIYWVSALVTGVICSVGLYSIWKTKTYTPIGYEHKAPATLGSFLLRVAMTLIGTFVPVLNTSLAWVLGGMLIISLIDDKFGKRIRKFLRRPL